ncbi:MAG: hypothetical protein L0Y73_00090, partial [Candidatus Aminicenantes bacterium]|nr:hypothetical protein [Candidatus Aminicenantes bacterium]
MKSIKKDFFRYFLVILLLAAATHFVLPAATDQEGREEKQAKESTPVSQKPGKGIGKFLKS